MVANKKGQAMVETIFMVPLIIAVLMFMYQGYILIHKAQISQKYLKAMTIGNVLNRYDVQISGTKGSFYFVYHPTVKYNLDEWTKYLLLVFARTEQRGRLNDVFEAFSGKQTMGLCLGGSDQLGVQVNPDVLTYEATKAWTCE